MSKSKLFMSLLLAVFLLFSSGRVPYGDPSEQLTAADHFARTGQLGYTTVALEASWDKGPNGRYYEHHDIGNILLMAPVAWLFRHRADLLLTKFGIGILYSVFSAAGAFWLYAALKTLYSRRASMALSLLFVFTTPYLVWSRTTWDVLGGAIGCCLFLYFLAEIGIRKRMDTAALLGLAAATGAAAAFRYTLLVPLVVMIGLTIWSRREAVKRRHVLTLAAGLILANLPTFCYNWVRMGNILRPGTTAQQWLSGDSRLTFDYVHSLPGLLLSPGWGLLFFAPSLLILLALPIYWRKMEPLLQNVTRAVLVGVLIYLLPIAAMKNWNGIFGWGSRYLMPLYPLLFFVAAYPMLQLAKTRRPIVMALSAAGALIQLPAWFINWSYMFSYGGLRYWGVGTEYAPLMNFPWNIMRFQCLAWKMLICGCQGKLLPTPEAATDPSLLAVRRFPDMWLARLIQMHGKAEIVGIAVTIVLLAAIVVTGRLVFAVREDEGEEGG